MSKLGDYFKALRGERTLQEIEAALQIHTSVLSRYELGKRVPRPDQMQRLADFFGVQTEKLQRLALQDQFSEALDALANDAELLTWAKNEAATK